MDWKEQLNILKEDPDLPSGADDTPESEEEITKDFIQKSPLHIVIEKKGRKGKVATIIEGFECDDEVLGEIAGRLKKKLGVGGSSRGGEILIQGDFRDRASQLLREEGFKVK